MHDFPEDAERLLARARDAQAEPTPEQRTRMRAGISVALTAGVASAATAHAAAQKGASALLGKLVLGVAGSALLVGTYVALPSARDDRAPPSARVERRAPASNAHVRHAAESPAVSEAPPPPLQEPPAQLQPAGEAPRSVLPSAVSVHRMHPPRPVGRVAAPVESEAPAVSATPVEPTVSPTDVEPVAPPAAAAVAPPEAKAPSLRDELALLARADAALSKGEPELALRALAEHRQRFPDSSLQAEREALSLLVRCQRDPGAAAQDVRRYLANPSAPLRTRLARCVEHP
ncbi:MAG TPA: hypothetical protein VI299_08150 [Polyangiales bacterium]